MKKCASFILFLFLIHVATSQTKKNFYPKDIDSLENVLKTQKDTFEIKTLLNISLAYSTKDPLKTIEYANKAISKSKKIGFRKGELKAYSNLGGIYIRLSDFKQAKRYIDTSRLLANKTHDYEVIARSYHNNGTIFYYQQQYDSAVSNFTTALNIALTKTKDSIVIGKLYNNIAGCYNLTGNFSKSIEYYLKSLKLNERINDAEGIIMANGNIGTVYYYMKNYPEAEKYMQKGREMAVKVQNKYQISAITLNLGVVYKDTKQYEKAEKEFTEALQVKKEIGDKNGEGTILVNVGEMASDNGDYNKALLNFKMAEKLAIEIKNPQIELYSYTCQANVYAKTGDFSNASKKYEQAIEMADKLSLKPDLIEIYKSYSSASANGNDYKKAYNYHVLYSTLKDSIFSADNNKMIAEMSSKYDSEKKQSQIELLNKEKEKQDVLSSAESKKQKLIIGFVSTGLFLVLVLAVFIFRSNRQKQKANIEITKQKEIIEERNKEVHDSITYAKRIQNAILPSDKIIKELFPNSFVLFKPKDIVSGDFYWFEKNGDKLLFAAVDCTGHGVPGAMVSVVGHNGLNRALKEFGLTQPSLILDKLTELVEETFANSENEVKDGMDISLICFDIKNNTFEWAGANNPIWINRQGHFEMIKADKQPIGVFDHRKPFTSHDIKVSKGDTIYIFTDGYADQFGGDKGKKFKYKQLEELLLTIQESTMEKQKEILESAFNAWKGNLEQIDDVCIIGLRV